MSWYWWYWRAKTKAAAASPNEIFGDARGTLSFVGRTGHTLPPRGMVGTLTMSGTLGHNGTLALAGNLQRTLDPTVPQPSGTLALSGSGTLTNVSSTINTFGSLVVQRGGSMSRSASAIAINNAQVTVSPLSLTGQFAGSPALSDSMTRTAFGDLALMGIASIPGALVYRRCETHTAYIYDRGGRKQIGALSPLALVRWERRRDDVSTATVVVAAPDKYCATMLELAEAGRMELVIYRGNIRVWEGPIMRISYRGDRVELEAHDVMRYVVRTAMENEYDNRYPNNGPVIERIRRIMTAEFARWEAVDPAANVLPHVQYIRATPPVVDAGTAAHTLPYEMTLFEHIDTYAARGGIDYTVVGRSILFFDVHQHIGQTAMVTRDDFIGDPIITQYGMELATRVIMTDGKGNHGEAGGVDPYYGIWEVIHQAYDENAGPVENNQPPSVAEMTSQAKRAWSASHYPPIVVRVPDNSRINPNGVLDIASLVPGVHIPLHAQLPGRAVTQMQKLDNMTVEETPENGETISVTLSPATSEKFVED